jgi:ATP-dependent RNA helicase DeaD
MVKTMKTEDMDIDMNLKKAIKALGFDELTPIQEKCIPAIKKGQDVVGQSSTGSGKTAAFGLPMLEKVVPGKGIQALVLTPTRELCVQVGSALKDFGRHMHIKITTVYGGVGISPQIDALRHVDIVVATPGRMLDHVSRRTVDLTKVVYLVLDEADKMFEMGFIDDVEAIIRCVPRNRQTMLFSATLGTNVLALVRKHLRSPVYVKTSSYVDTSLLHHVYYDVGAFDKFSLLVHLLSKNSEGRSLVFCARRTEVDIVARNLKLNGIFAAPIHGGLSQNKRDNSMDLLKSDKINVLVATDVAARGLDIKNVTHVYNYDVPKSSEDYVHRVGRTARAGNQGIAATLLSDRDYENFDRVLRDRSLEIKKVPTPAFQKLRFVRSFHHDGLDRRERHPASGRDDDSSRPWQRKRPFHDKSRQQGFSHGKRFH